MDIDTIISDSGFDLIGSDLNIDDILFKLTLKCPFNNKVCSISEIEKLKKINIENRHVHIMNIPVEKKLYFLSKHYNCYNDFIRQKN